MDKNVSRMPDFGSNYLQAGCSVIHFYYSETERARFLPFIGEGQALKQTVVVAGAGDLLDVLSAAAPADLRGRQAIRYVALGSDARAFVQAIIDEVRRASASGAMVRLLVDFAHSVTSEIFEIEAALSAGLQGIRLMTVTQYDGNAIPAPLTVEQFKTHTLAIVGDAFFYENRKHIAPESYVRGRAAGAGR